jgi:L,D-peptidoglycan transpeptidase YkuD (ErfK/YbiS/YcfS/YnhG family)
MSASPDAGFALVFPDGRFVLGGLVLRCALGRGGVAPTGEKREGDGATPAARMKLRRVLFRADRGQPPRCALPVEPVAPSDGWCDDPAHRSYNRPVQLPFDGSHEALWRDDAVYDVIGVLGWNDEPVERGRGSAIFLHVARADYRPTQGCVALAERDLRAVLEAGLLGVHVMEA